jgi:ubiquinone/menaquinone biosynthesis C-methylase UbiE
VNEQNVLYSYKLILNEKCREIAHNQYTKNIKPDADEVLMAAKFDDLQPLKRFSSRAGDYKNRWGYAPALLDYLRETYGLAASTIVVDVGAGTGFLTRVLLQSGCRVHAVEPNAEMRAVAEAEMGGHSNFISVPGQAEHLPLADASMDALTVGQALHWFQIEPARTEFLRVLKPGGWMAVVYNRAVEDANDLERGIEEVCQRHFVSIGKAEEPPLRVVHLFEGMDMRTKRLANSYQRGRETFIRAMLNSSLAPEPGSEGYLQAAAELGVLFAFHAEGGLLARRLETVVYSAWLPKLV